MRVVAGASLGILLSFGCNATQGRPGGAFGLADEEQDVPWSEIDGSLLEQLKEAAKYLGDAAEGAEPPATGDESGGQDGGGEQTSGNGSTGGGSDSDEGGGSTSWGQGSTGWGGSTSWGGDGSSGYAAIDEDMPNGFAIDDRPQAISSACLAVITDPTDVKAVVETAGVYGLTVGGTCLVAAPVVAAPTGEIALPAVAVVCGAAGGGAAVLGAASSYLSQKVPNLVECGGDLISSALSALTSTPAPTKVFTAAENYPCGIPAEVAQTGPNAACQEMYEAYKAADSKSSSCGSINVASLTQAEIPAACDEIRTLFGNGHEAAKLRKEHGEACYPNAGGVGPMGAADFGHQKAWCQIMRSMNGCVDKATDPRMQCDIDGEMSSFGYPPDCDNLLSGVCG